jgi:hypothetical protein
MASIASLALRGCGSGGGRLTCDQQIALDVVGGGIMEAVCGCNIITKGEGVPVPFEQATADLLLVNWAKGTTAAQKTIIAHLRAGRGVITDVEMDAILVDVQRQINAQFIAPTAGKTPELFTGSYNHAKKNILKRHKKRVTFSFADTAAHKWLNEHHIYWIGSYYDRFVSGAIAKEAAIGMEAGLGRVALGRQLSDFFGRYPGVPMRPDHYWRLIAANAMNRSRQFGLVSGYEEVGVRTLEILAVMDARTSAVCREMNGRKFSLGRAITQRNQMMMAEEPEDVKTISPWLNKIQVAELKGMSTSAINDKGLILPPFHALCRTTTVEAAT